MEKGISDVLKSVKGVATSVSDAAGAVLDSSNTFLKESVGKAEGLVCAAGDAAAYSLSAAVENTVKLAVTVGGTTSTAAVKSCGVIHDAADAMAESAVSGMKSAGEAAGVAANVAKRALSAATVLVCDLNGDGKVDLADAKIAAEKMREVAGAAANEVGKLGKEVLQSDLVKDAAGGAIVGAALASAIPFVGTTTGAVVGAAFGLQKNLGRKS